MLAGQPMRGRRTDTILHFLLAENAAGRIPMGQPEAAAAMDPWLRHAHFIPLGLKPSRIFPEDIRHDLSEMRRALKRAGATWHIPQRSLALPPAHLHIREPAAP